MKCYNHPQVEAVGVCGNCGKAICQSCLVDVGGQITCKSCLASGNVLKTQSEEVKTATSTNILAIISLILGVLGLCGGLPFSVFAWVTGNIAQKQLLDNPNQTGMQLANIGMWLGIGSTILWTVILVIGVLLGVLSS